MNVAGVVEVSAEPFAEGGDEVRESALVGGENGIEGIAIDFVGEGGEDLDPGYVGLVAMELFALAAHDAEAAGGGIDFEFVDDAGFADAGFAVEEEALAVAGGDFVEVGAEDFEDVGAADEGSGAGGVGGVLTAGVDLLLARVTKRGDGGEAFDGPTGDARVADILLFGFVQFFERLEGVAAL